MEAGAEKTGAGAAAQTGAKAADLGARADALAVAMDASFKEERDAAAGALAELRKLREEFREFRAEFRVFVRVFCFTGALVVAAVVKFLFFFPVSP